MEVWYNDCRLKKGMVYIMTTNLFEILQMFRNHVWLEVRVSDKNVFTGTKEEFMNTLFYSSHIYDVFTLKIGKNCGHFIIEYGVVK